MKILSAAYHIMSRKETWRGPQTFEDLMKAGIVDPTKVTRFALQNAASVAGLLMTTEAMVAEKPKKEKPSAPAMPSEDMY